MAKIIPSQDRGPSQADRLIGIEILRFLAAIAVLTWHFQHFAYLGDKPLNFVRELQPFYVFLSPFYNFGMLGVQVFWCISGFIFFWKYADALSTRKVSGRSFTLARFARLYPLHIATLFLVAILQWMYFTSSGRYFVYQANDLRHFGLQLAMASNWGLQSGDSFNGPIWSVSVEVLAYLFFYFVTRYLSITKIWQIAAVAVISVVIAHLRVDHPNQVHILECVSCFYLGGMTARAYLFMEGQRQTMRVVADLSILIVGMFLALCISSNWGPWKLFYVAVLCLIYLSCRYIRPSITWQNSLLESLGNLTYSSYLLHFPLQLITVIVSGWLGWAISYQNKALFIGYMLTSFGAAGLCFNRFERPAQGYLKQKLGRRRESVFPAGATRSNNS